MLCFTIQNRLQAGTSKVSEAAGARWRFYRRISSDYGRIVFLLAEALQGFSAQILTFKISWQAQYLVRLEGDLTGSAHWKWRFICDADHWWHWFCVAGAVFGEVGGSFCVAGAVFGEVGGWLFVTGAALRDILGDSRDAKCCILQYKIVSKLGRVRSPKRRVRDDDFIVGYRRISSDYGRIVFLLAEALQGFSAQILTFKISWQAQYLVRFEGDLTGSAHWKWRFICDTDHWRHDFVWQVQYLVRLGGDFTSSTHWKWGFICDANHSWHSFCVAGAVFGEVGGWLDLLHALEMSFHMWRRSSMTFILRGRRSIWWGWMETWLAPRIRNELSYVTQIIDDIHFAWQKLDGDSCCATHYRVVVA